MLCEKCKVNPAAVHVTQNINGAKTEAFLCAACAAAQNPLAISFDNMFASFLESLFENSVSETVPEKAPLPNDGKECPNCGLSLAELKEYGKLGCSDCYETFRGELNHIIKNLNGSNRHEGKFPKRAGALYAHKREIEHLKADLKRAVENEEFEAAAKLRDEIRKLGSA